MQKTETEKNKNPVSNQIGNCSFKYQLHKNQIWYSFLHDRETLLISATKLGDSFPSDQFKICKFCMPDRYERGSMGGGLLLYIKRWHSNQTFES